MRSGLLGLTCGIIAALITVTAPASADNAAAPVSFRAYPDPNSDRCYRSRDHDTADLCAQWRAAVAGEKSAFWSMVAVWLASLGVVLSLGGLVGLLRSLRQANLSLAIAKQSADDQRKVTATELRPWVAIEVIAIQILVDDDKVEMRYDIKCTNLGSTVASEFHYRGRTEFTTDVDSAAEKWWPMWGPQTKPVKTTLMPGESILLPGFSSASHDSIKWQPWGLQKYVFAAVATSAFYRSPFDDDWRRTDRLFVVGEPDVRLPVPRILRLPNLMRRDKLVAVSHGASAAT